MSPQRRAAGMLTVAVLVLCGPRLAAYAAEPTPRLAYSALDEQGEEQLFTAERDGTARRQLTDQDLLAILYTPQIRTTLSWFPDGRSIAVTETERTNDGSDEPRILRVDAEEPESVTVLVDDAEAPAVRQDGQRVAFRPAAADDEIGTVAADGSDEERAKISTFVIEPPEWDPLGRRLVFIGGQGPFAGPQPLYDVAPNGTGLRRLSPAELDVRSARVGATAVAFVADPPGEDPPQAYVVDPAVPEVVQRVTDVPVGREVQAAALSPDGREVAVADAEDEGRGTTLVRILPVGGGEARTLAAVPSAAPDELTDTYLIDWSATGEAVAVSTEIFDSGGSRFFAVDVVDTADGEVTSLGDPFGFEENGARPRSAVFHPAVPLPPVERHEGPTRFATAAAVAEATTPSADAVVIARADDYADALAGAPLATDLDAPVLLTGTDRLSLETAGEVRRLDPARAVLLGGQAALSETVAEDLRDLGVEEIDRIAGPDRFATAQLVANRLDRCDEAFLVKGRDADPDRGFPDAISASSLAAATGAPILLTDTNALPATTRDALRGCDAVTVVGGSAAVTDAVAQAAADAAGVGQVERLAGADRYATSAEVLRAQLRRGLPVQRIWAATGANWPDALAAGPAAARLGDALVLLPGDSITAPAAMRAVLATAPARGVVAVGDAGVLAPAVVADAARALSTSSSP